MAKVEKDWAAVRILRNDAVRLDLNDDLLVAACVRTWASASTQQSRDFSSRSVRAASSSSG